MSTFILPFDHRNGLAREIMGTSYPFSPADRERACDLKRVIYDAFLLVHAERTPHDHFAVLIDEETGSAILHDAHERGIATILTLEQSGGEPFRLQYGEQSCERMQSLHASLGKVLIHFSCIPKRDDAQLVTLQKLHAQCTHAGQSLLIELLSSGSEDTREHFLTHTIGLATSMGIIPAFWKVEGLPSASAWNAVRTVAHASSDILVLGRGEDQSHAEKMVRIAAQSRHDEKPTVNGFAIGRTIFADPLRSLLAGKLDREGAVHRIADNFRFFVAAWKRA